MAHNLNIQNGQASLMYVGNPPWHHLGTALPGPATAEQAIQAASLDWEVMRVPLFAQEGKRQEHIENHWAIVRCDQWEAGAPAVLGIVGYEYRPLQNREAFTFFDPIVGSNAAIYHTAGALGNGERVWILAKLPAEIRVTGEDVTHKYLLLSNSHDGSSSVQVKFTPIRVVCENTLTMALSSGPTVRIRHDYRLSERLQQAERLLGLINTRYEQIEKAFREMVRVQLNETQLTEYLFAVFPDPKESEDPDSGNWAKRQRFWSEYFFDQGAGNSVKGTLWAAYNGITEYVDHGTHSHASTSKRLENIWFGEGYLIKARAYRAAEEILRTRR